MKFRSPLLIILLLLMPAVCRTQDINDKVLMAVGENEIQSGEFIRMYNKSLEPGQKVDIDSYLQDYIIFKLKVADALQEGYDTTKAFITELNGYRNQLAQNYLTDTQTKERLLQKAYKRSLTEINAWHILIAMPPENSSPPDTIKAWNKACDIRERIINGEPFEQVARGSSDDKSVMANGGNLGYFTVFQMIMPFEDAAYNLQEGALSMPVRTPYGYHIIMVTDKRPANGRIKVAHIMKAAPPGSGEKEVMQAEDEINNIYIQLNEGVPFGELAEKYSDHKESAVNGGELNWFGTGEIIGDFSEAAFSLRDTGSYTKPVRTLYGWHIIKLLDRKEPGSFDESRSYLESKINLSYLNSISKKSFVESLKKEYKFRINQIAYRWFIQNTDTLIIQGMRKFDRITMPDTYLYSFANQLYTTSEFADYIEKRGAMMVTDNIQFFISSLIETQAADQIISYENTVLENKYPEFRYLMNEFHDGILLFEISGKKVWNRIENDSAGLHQYYEDHKYDYLTKKGIDATIYTLRISQGEKSLLTAFNKYRRKPDADRRLSEKFNKNTDTLLTIEKGIWFQGDDTKIDNIPWVTGYRTLSIDGYPSIILINRIIEPEPLSFTEVQGEMMSRYQEEIESDWIRQLKERYDVKIDSFELNEVKKRINNE